MEKHNHEHHKHHTHEGHQKSQSSDHQTINKSDHQHGHHDHHAMMIEDFKKRFWISLVLTVPILALSHMIQQLLGFELTFFGDQYVLFGLSTIVFFYGGWPFLKGLWDELKDKNPGMMTLIAVAITVAYVYSSAVVFGLEGMDFFWELATLIVIMLLGHWIEMKSVMGASRALELLVQMMPSEAHLVQGDQIKDIKVDQLKKEDIILIKANEKIPADGTVVDGESHLDESMLTGESKPVKKSKGDPVIGGSVNGSQSIKVKVSKTGKESYLNKVITLVEEAQKAKSKTQNLANVAARWLTFIAIGAGTITLFTWISLGKPLDFALERMVTVMVISCPHALGLAIPLVVAISTAVSAGKGLLIRNRTAFENARKITAMVFDKTGTLTEGKFGVSRYESLSDDMNKNELLSFAASLEQQSEHPIAQGIVKAAKEAGLALKKVENFESLTAKGIQGKIEGQNWKVVSPGYLKENDINIPDQAGSDEAETIVYVLQENLIIGFIALSDQIREESPKAIETLREKGMKLYMATGDNEKTAKAVSEKLGLDGYYSEVLPHQKVEIIKKLQKEGHFVAMTGDGVNDAPALAQANVGIAVGSGTDVAAETADIILVNSNPKDIANLVLFGRATYNKMIQNLAWATGYNAIALPLATGFIPGLVISPAIGAVFMSLSTVIVAINAQLLKRKIKN
ncbi:MAG: copper-translocating P-type ATPase [Cytophagales bacterium]|uniref:Cu2+-exporting ATPase n=1 Tax=Algoriphagus iocasae TaxID=1836499 RepID=A0A841MS80_9BACT|nr:copper-translocating P-type ATPase [Algoriphagus iocasae]MBB6325395.1 Cu2+-exporting ATPase [Algoriphagus iocasae]MBR9776468.1 copper-translocating P-type ATPase [Cytophagales bacterium]|tara:strand:+ start:8590 stop:10644 length:2055 start_codon:yes stop_codon:yes gene_type:complete